ncbi:MAG: type II toxin-antitoxin system VapC family toxin [Cyclobacteriaceae bacterium]|jgi:predicted nucleic acid-binding protein
MSAIGNVILPGSKVFFDTPAFIYFCEERQPYLEKLTELFDRNDRGDFQILTSTVTLIEVLTLPLRQGAWQLASEYQEIISNSPFIFVVPLDVAIARKAADLRAAYGLQTPDAIQLATAISSGCTAFLTNDQQLSVVKEINVIQLAE